MDWELRGKQMQACSNTLCKNNAANSPKMKRYGERCLAKLCENHNKTTVNVNWILNNSVNDCMYRPDVLTDEELAYCLEKETRKTGQAKLKAELKRRKICYENS